MSHTAKTILVANRGEIAVRIIRTLSELGWRSVAVYAEDDSLSLHALKADIAVPLSGSGASAYLDQAQMIAIARQHQCDGVHPGYGFLSENSDFARACEQAGLVFVGPDADTLALFGDKARARALAAECGVPVLQGMDHSVSLQQAEAFFAQLPAGSAMAIKAIAGGGGRGLRVVRDSAQLAAAYARCQSEAESAFGDGSVYVEQWAPAARHIEVQVLGDGSDCVHLYERECSLQRRHQKVIEMAPSCHLSPTLKHGLFEAALAMAQRVGYRGLGTFEFLVFEQAGDSRFVFIEANPRIQVEHTVTETILGLDLVALQLAVAFAAPLAELHVDGLSPSGFAVQARINLEALQADGEVKPAAGRITSWDVPGGHGVRVDSYVYSGYQTSPRYDSMVAKLIVHSARPDHSAALRKLSQALQEFRIGGLASNLSVLRNLACHPDVLNGAVDTGFIDAHMAELTQPEESLLPARDAGADESGPQWVLTDNSIAAPMQGSVVAISVECGRQVNKGEALLIMDAMKMEHVIEAPGTGYVESFLVADGDGVMEGQPLLVFQLSDQQGQSAQQDEVLDPDAIRPDLQECIDRHAYGLDENRPDAVARRHGKRQRTARENIADLCDDGSFVEYGPLVIAAQRRRRTLQDLMENTPGDGMVTGLGCINSELFGDDAARCVVMTYDYTVLAGTQGIQNHHKKDRMFELAERMQVPVVLFSEGGGGRPGDTDGLGSSAGLDCLAFLYFARLSALVPLVGIASGRNFAGNAALLGCCDVVIATRNANIGMGGPAMIEGGGLGVYRPEEVGPVSVQAGNGVVDIVVEDEQAATATAKRYLSYFQGDLSQWQAPDQRLLRTLIPENRLRVYSVRAVMDGLCDIDSVLELRSGFGKGMVTALARIEGRAVGVIANNPEYLAGAVDADGADKASRFMQMCDAFDIPLLFLCDTPGIMVGPEVEKTALVRHAARMFVTAASLTVPFFTVVLRKAYGLGAMTMAGGSMKAPLFTLSWPTGEFGAMGLEGAVKLGFRKELNAIADPLQRQARFEEMVAEMVERGKAVNNATFFEFDDVIDPAQTRHWIVAGLQSAPRPRARHGKKRPCVDTW
ncbi:MULTISPECIES: carboxyl transferase domain-containing protein [unclassified Ketobacter]|uniref:carboxyl transferase domain-containing protein n=1 Tax=unclassified Ketobacter TaxID=2639109 RepID=UPI000F0D21C4|nr:MULTISPECIES: carboxyl transferase domain-containing protein [unclassified Ketobacter]RLT87648.1 MAG: ATP-grasp domain-containing protein [Ketobacter sp. GenoA1]RLT96687.1 MAG: ATP-grasp domain-containing protein [Ketobacter sp.]